MSSYEHKVRTRLGSIYHNMKTRCTNPNYDKYKYYGGKGVSICDEWLKSYDAFEEWALSHGYKDHLTLERKDVNGNYTPENCCWVSRKKQANNRTSNRYIKYRGKTKTVAEWSEITGINYKTLSERIDHGWPIYKAMTTPVQNTKHPRYITFNGETKQVYEWAAEIGMPYNTLHNRLARGWSIQEALSVPLGGQR